MDPWAKYLCSSVGKSAWKNLMESKKYVHLYENVMRWNDSAVEEAFKNAEALFWGCPCDTPLLDPKAFIDEIDWSNPGNPESILEEEETEYSPCKIVGLEALDQLDPSFSSFGWGPCDEAKEEELMKKDNEAREVAAAAEVRESSWNKRSRLSSRRVFGPGYGGDGFPKDRWRQGNIGIRKWVVKT